MSLVGVCALTACGSQSTHKEQDIIRSAAIPVDQFYSQAGPDQTWQQVLDSGDLNPLQTFTTKGVTAPRIDIDNKLIETGPYGDIPIDSAKRKLFIHAVGNPSIPHTDFHKWSRWYQEDGNTQIFRLFKGEENVSNQRANAARIEAFSPGDRWLPEPGVWREFGARFTVVESAGCVGFHHCSIFQAKGNNVDHWSVMLRVDEHGNLWYHPRRGFGIENSKNRQLISKNVLSKPFDLKVRDNGNDYEMYIDGQLVGTGQWRRTEEIGFRWGIYVGESEVADDVVVLVTGVTMK